MTDCLLAGVPEEEVNKTILQVKSKFTRGVIIGLDKRGYPVNIFLISAQKTCVVGTH